MSDKKGVTAIEYAMIASLVGISIIASLKAFGDTLREKYECIASAISGSGACGGGDSGDSDTSFSSESVSHNITKGWFTSEIKVKAGETYEITLPENSKITYWNGSNGGQWFDPVDRFAATITSSSLSTPFISNSGKENSTKFNSFDNSAVLKDGKVTITAQQDGFLSTGILDVNGQDNWVTTDGGNTVSQNLDLTITRVK